MEEEETEDRRNQGRSSDEPISRGSGIVDEKFQDKGTEMEGPGSEMDGEPESGETGAADQVREEAKKMQRTVGTARVSGGNSVLKQADDRRI
jgi:hypothetical protein